MARRTRTPSAPRRIAAWTILCAFSLTLPGAPPALAAPAGEQVIEGDATFTRDGDTTTIDTTTDQTIVEYDTFDIHVDEVVRINQPHEEARILNRVPHGDPTRIDGLLTSNGIVYILNPAGVFAGDTAIIDVSGLVAGAGELSNDDFLAGVDDFTGLTGDVTVAEGARIEASDLVALVGRRVANYGSIKTEGGMIALVAGDRAVLARIDGHLRVKIDPSHAEAQPVDAGFALTQAGRVDAGAGAVSLTAGDTYSLAMNHTGITHGREVELHAGGDALVQVAGTLDASALAPGEIGGSIQVTGGRVALLDARLDATGDAGGGEILVGGDAHGEGDVPTARRTFVGSDAVLVADAVREGDGGKVIVWSDEKTGFYGTLSARGGEASGDGGFAEISGKSLESRGMIDLGAANGASGTLLYDPDRIVIMGGVVADGADRGDTSPTNVVGDDGVAGRILGNQVGEVVGGVPVFDPFIVYESEIEGTDANILLEATTKIETAGTFTNDSGNSADGMPDGDGVVVLKAGNSLQMRTTGNGALEDPDDLDSERIGIDLQNVEWRVSEGGTIAITTSAGDARSQVAGEQASIRVGKLVYGGPAFEELDDIGIGIPQVGVGSVVRVASVQGNVSVQEIVADGADATATRVASDGGNIQVGAVFGDVTTGPISSIGGGAFAGTPTEDAIAADGGDGGSVTIVTNVGKVTVDGDIDVSGGDGHVGFREGRIVPGNGGTGGVIAVASDPGGISDVLTGTVEINGDLIARGGNGEGFLAIPTGRDPLLVVAAGGFGGRVGLTAVAGITIGDLAAERLRVDASAGSGAGAGAPVTPNQVEFAVTLATSGIPVGEIGGDIALQNVDFVVNGGDAGFAGGPGGAGGQAGAVFATSARGEVQASTASFQANGGAGAFTSDGADTTPGSGGAAGVIQLAGERGVASGSIQALGGAAKNGVGGRGGEVRLISSLGDVAVDQGIDISGGDAARVTDTIGVGTSEFAGGEGGTVVLATGQDNVAVTGGDVEIGDVVRTVGGVGVESTRFEEGGPITDEAVVAAGGRVDIDADGDVSTQAGTRIEAGRIEIDAATVGATEALVIAGTDADADRADIAAKGRIQVEVSDDPMHADTLESLTLIQRDVASATTVRSGGATLLSVIGNASFRRQTVQMMTDDTDASLDFRFEEFIEDPLNPPAVAPVVAIAGALSVGVNGGGIANGTTPTAANAGSVLAGAGASVTTRGLFTLSGATIGAEMTPIEVNGSSAAAVAFEANGAIWADIDTPMGAIGVTQSDGFASTTISRSGSDQIRVSDASGGNPLAPRQDVSVDTTAVGASFSYRLKATTPIDPLGVTVGTAPALVVSQMQLGGSGLLDAPGDITIQAQAMPTIAVSGGSDLTLVSGRNISVSGAGTAIDMGAADDGLDADLILVAGGAVGGPLAPLVTTGIERLAATHGGGFHLENRDTGDIRIAELMRVDPLDLSGETDEGRVTGILAPSNGVGDVVIDNQSATGKIVLGAIPLQALSSGATHIASIGDLHLIGDVELENAQFIPTATLDASGKLVTELVAVNRGRLFALGDIEITGAVDTSAGAFAKDTREGILESDRLADEFAAGELTVTSPTGTVTFRGDIGTHDAGTLALLDTTRAVLADVSDGTTSVRAGRALFRGTLDSDGAVEIQGVDVGDPETFVNVVSFGGDIGTKSALTQLDVRADAVNFTIANSAGAPLSAERVVVGTGGLLIETDTGVIPTQATITDVSGNLAIVSKGDVTLGKNTKFSSTGTIDVKADGNVTVGDLSADEIRLRADADRNGVGDIIVRLRDAGRVELPDGTIVFETDGPTLGGVDLVANDIFLGSNPIFTDSGPAPTLVIGSGGLSMPGSLAAWNLIRYTPDLQAVAREDFVSIDGEVLDLRGTGGAFAGNPAGQLEREAYLDPTAVPARQSEARPVTAPEVSAREVFAFLRCGLAGMRGTAVAGCAVADAEALRALADFENGSLATPRAREMSRRYRALLVAEKGVARLRADFAAVGLAFGTTREWSDGTLDGAALYRFLAASRTVPGALAALRELAWLGAEARLLGVSAEDASALDRQLSEEFARGAELQGFDAEQVRAAVATSPVGLARK